MSAEIILVFDFIIISLLLYPPKENYVVGYRTKRSMKNIENRKFSQKYFSKLWLIGSVNMVITQLIILIFMANIALEKGPFMILIISIIDYW